ncbi:hypothetical protein DIPPA_25143 [Diplonema papillatum]|nr:hypothetical protein DIPPA_25143 [Diplonema papillatum]
MGKKQNVHLLVMARILLGLCLFAAPVLAAQMSITAELEHYSTRPKFAPFVVRYNQTASGKKVIVLPYEAPSRGNPDGDDGGQVEIAFKTTERSVINVNIAGLFPDRGSDSFFYRLDDEEYRKQEGPAVTGDWDVFGRAYPFIEAGRHKLMVKAREPGAILDKVTIRVLDGEIFYSGPLLRVEFESLSSQSSFPPFVIEPHAKASGGQYIVLPSSATPRLDPAQGTDGQVEIPFILTKTADVNLAVRASFPTEGSASFFYKLDDQDFQTLPSRETGDDWVFLSVMDYSAVEKGRHTLVIKGREHGVKLDRVTLLTSTGGISMVRNESDRPAQARVSPAVPLREDPPQYSFFSISAFVLALLCVGGAILF